MIYPFLLNMWMMNKVDEVYLKGQVTRGHITQKECDMIIASPRLPEN